jgi:hypothetical protein
MGLGCTPTNSILMTTMAPFVGDEEAGEMALFLL